MANEGGGGPVYGPPNQTRTFGYGGDWFQPAPKTTSTAKPPGATPIAGPPSPPEERTFEYGGSWMGGGDEEEDEVVIAVGSRSRGYTPVVPLGTTSTPTMRGLRIPEGTDLNQGRGTQPGAGAVTRAIPAPYGQLPQQWRPSPNQTSMYYPLAPQPPYAGKYTPGLAFGPQVAATYGTRDRNFVGPVAPPGWKAPAEATPETTARAVPIPFSLGGKSTTPTGTRTTTTTPTAQPQPPTQYPPRPGGGGGGGGGGTSTAPTEGLPDYYVTWFNELFGDATTYYTPDKGGPEQAQNDYKNIVSIWQNFTGRYITPAEMQALLATISAYLRGLGRLYTFQDVFDYLNLRFTQRKTTPPSTSYYNLGEF